MKRVKIVREEYLDNVPDMAGLSPYTPDGKYRDYLMVKTSEKTKLGKDKWIRVPFRPWETPKAHLKAAHAYHMIKLDDGEEVFVKAPTTFDKDRLVDKIDKFITDEYGPGQQWEFAGTISPNVAKERSLWEPA